MGQDRTQWDDCEPALCSPAL